MNLRFFLFVTGVLACTGLSAQTGPSPDTTHRLYLDVHHMGAGKVTVADVAIAHRKDLAVQKKYGVSFLQYWVDEDKGDIYCLVSSAGSEAFVKTHKEAHGLIPDEIYEVKSDSPAALQAGSRFFLDRHEMGAGKVKAQDVAAAHQKDLAVESRYGVNFINYWVDEGKGTIFCLSQAPDTQAVISTHRDAHGLVPVTVTKVAAGQ